MNRIIKTLLVGLIFSSCIGTDVLDDVEVMPTLTIETGSFALMIGESMQIVTKYTNQFGLESEAEVIWNISDGAIASVSNTGLVTALGEGQAQIIAQFQGVESSPINVTVVEDINDVASVVVDAPKEQIAIGESMQMTATVSNILEEELVGQTVTWSLSDESVASISAEGLLTGLTDGVVEVVGTADGVRSDPFIVMVGSQVLTATFQGSGGYRSEGTASLYFSEGDLFLELSSDFSASIALGTFIYLANSRDGSDVKGGGLKLGEYTPEGTRRWNISALNADADLDTYRYCIVLCEPAAITFGFADFQEE